MSAQFLAKAYSALEDNDLLLVEQACRQALKADRTAGEPLHLLGISARRQDRLAEAEALLREAWRRSPDKPEIANNLCALLCAVGAHDDGLAVADSGLARHPAFTFLHANRGVALHGLRREEEAAAAFRAALEGIPDLELALFGLASALEALGRRAEAEPVLRALLVSHPSHAEGANLLGRVLTVLERNAEACEAFRLAVALNPDHAAAYSNLSSVLLKLEQPEEALAAVHRSLELDPANSLACLNASIICQELVRLDEAIAYSRRAIELDPDNIDAHWCQSLQLLHSGQWGRGFQEYEWRWRLPFHRMLEGPPVWAGEILGANALLVNAEQGQGDSLQFLRYVPMLRPFSSNLILRVQDSLKRLTKESFPEAAVIGYADDIPPVPFQVPLISLPRLFHTRTEADIPAPIPYLRSNRLSVEAWHQRWATEEPMIRIGLAWRGSPTYKRDALRSLPLDMMAPLLKTPGCRFFALHPDINDEEHTALRRLGIGELSSCLTDFTDTAALLETLELVISVDTSVVHLAGALGRPVWALLPFSCDWRWGTGREDTPWYPSAKLFRQPKAKDWESVIAAVSEALRLV
jgi:tetratricopeptide (TPR) repeat protein